MRYVILVFSQLAVGSAAILVRFGLAAGVGPLALTVWRLTVAVAVLLPILWRLARNCPAPEVLPLRTSARLVLAGGFLALHFWAWFVSLEHVSVARSTLLVSTTPVWAGLGSWLFLRRPPRPLFWGGLAICGFGAYLVTGAGHGAPRQVTGASMLLGDATALAGAALIAAYFLLTADLQTRIGTWRVVAWTYTSAALWLWPCVPWFPGASSMLPSGAVAWLAIAGLALVPQLTGHTALNWSLRHFSAGAVSATTLLEPVFAGLLAWMLFGEALRGLQLAGALLLLAGISLTIGRTARTVPESPLRR